MKSRVFAFIALLAMVALSCGIPTVGNTTQPTQAVVVPPVQPTTAPTSKVLFQDDFTNTGSGWDSVSDSSGVTDYYNGAYRIQVLTDSLSIWANPSKSFPADVRVEVDATKNGGPDDNAFGVICRYQDTDNFYRFYITSDGYIGIVRRQGGNATVISSADGKLQPASGFKTGAATNHIEGDCIGNTLTMYVNGTQMAQATDSSFTSGGDVGLIAQAFSTAGVDILFHNFVVTAP
jgi:hypothetical protein